MSGFRQIASKTTGGGKLLGNYFGESQIELALDVERAQGTTGESRKMR